MSLPAAIPRPETGAPDTGNAFGWIVTVYNNEHNTYDEVIHILIVATGCSPEEAEIETWEIDHLGKSVVHHGQMDECEGVAAVIAQIGIDVRVSQE
jgi:hypothetical protein